MGCDCLLDAVSVMNVVFQSTHPHGVRRILIRMVLCVISFNPRTHMGCDGVPLLKFVVKFGFNPRTHMGCDLLLMTPYLVMTCFNPRTHMGCDGASSSVVNNMHVSIHAPTWGATVCYNSG